MTPEQKERLTKIEIKATREPRSYPSDLHFLLSLVKSQETLARELALIVDVGTCDDPGTALSKLHKIQHVAAISMRSACVEKVRALADEHQASSKVDFDDASQVAFWLYRAAAELESVSIQGQEK